MKSEYLEDKKLCGFVPFRNELVPIKLHIQSQKLIITKKYRFYVAAFVDF